MPHRSVIDLKYPKSNLHFRPNFCHGHATSTEIETHRRKRPSDRSSTTSDKATPQSHYVTMQHYSDFANSEFCRSVKICQSLEFSRIAMGRGLAFLWVFHFLLNFMACSQSMVSSVCRTDSKHEKVAVHSEHGLSVGPFLRFEWIASMAAKRPIVKVCHALIGWITLDEDSTRTQGRPNFHIIRPLPILQPITSVASLFFTPAFQNRQPQAPCAGFGIPVECFW